MEERGGREEWRRRGLRVEERSRREEWRGEETTGVCLAQGSVWLRGLQERGAPDPD